MENIALFFMCSKKGTHLSSNATLRHSCSARHDVHLVLPGKSETLHRDVGGRH